MIQSQFVVRALLPSSEKFSGAVIFLGLAQLSKIRKINTVFKASDVHPSSATSVATPRFKKGTQIIEACATEPVSFDLSRYNLKPRFVYHNPTPAKLYELGLQKGSGLSRPDGYVTSAGAFAAFSGDKCGRSPKDKRFVDEPTSNKSIWWGDVNIKMTEAAYDHNRERSIDYLNTRETLYCMDLFANWDPKNRFKVRVICARPYHALFVSNMFIRPTEEELRTFGEPDFTIFNAGQFNTSTSVAGMTSRGSADIHLGKKEMIILGTEYAGEMKKGVFSVLQYYLPKKGLLTLHSSCNETPDGRTTVYCGLSGTGKTSLSTLPPSRLIGDDEHFWTEDGIFNIEGGCYAKADHLSPSKEAEIFSALKFGAVLENVVFDPTSRSVDFNDLALTPNTRGAYPIDHIPSAKIPCLGAQPSNIVFLTCDAFGVLPLVSKLNPDQAMYHFISGYTAKIPGTETGVDEPTPVFSACFGEPFIPLHPSVYATLLAEKMRKNNVPVWLVNTGWIKGGFPHGQRSPIDLSRAIVRAIQDNKLNDVPMVEMPVFRFGVPQSCPGVPKELMNPRESWADKAAYDATVKKVAALFEQNFKRFASPETADIQLKGGPKL